MQGGSRTGRARQYGELLPYCQSVFHDQDTCCEVVPLVHIQAWNRLLLCTSSGTNEKVIKEPVILIQFLMFHFFGKKLTDLWKKMN